MVQKKIKKNLFHDDPLIASLVNELSLNYSCHTIILYGSRARGDATKNSDYDLMGVCSSGNPFRIARKEMGFYIDIFIFPESELKVVNEKLLYMEDGKVLKEKNKFGTNFLSKLKIFSHKKFNPISKNEIGVRKIWLHKMLERSYVGDIEGMYRRSWLQEALLYEYFALRKLRFKGPKLALQWLKKNDILTFRLFLSSLKNPTDTKSLRKIVIRVSGIKDPTINR